MCGPADRLMHRCPDESRLSVVDRDGWAVGRAVVSRSWKDPWVRARLHHLILDCADPKRLAQFYSALLNEPITHTSDDFVVIADNDETSRLAFQRVPDHRRPTWPSAAVPQQMHLDIMVENVDEARPHVLRLGATSLDGQDVFADPAGHPFCLIKRPNWAAPILE